MENILFMIYPLCLLLSSLGVLVFKKPVHSCLSFLFSLITLAGIYLELFASFIAVMQILVYAGAILVIFMFVIILFQDAHQQIERFPSKNNRFFIIATVFSLVAVVSYLSYLIAYPLTNWASMHTTDERFGDVQPLGQSLYLHFFFPFELVVLLFLIALVGSVYIAKRE